MKPAYSPIENLRIVPCVHGRVGFAEQVRRLAVSYRPEIIAVELPDTLKEWIIRGAMRLPRLSAVCWHEPEAQRDLQYVPLDPCDATIEAVRLGLEHERPLEFIDLDLRGLHEPPVYVPDDLIVDRAGLEAYVARVAPFVKTAADDHHSLAREVHMALRLRELAGTGRRVLAVIGIAHYPRLAALLGRGALRVPDNLDPPVATERAAYLTDPTPRSVQHMLREIPWVAWLYETSRGRLDLAGDRPPQVIEDPFDKLQAVQSILHQAEGIYRALYRERINITQWKALLQYTRNLALVSRQLTPDLLDTVVGAIGTVDGDFGHEVHQQAISYPPQEVGPADHLPRLKLREHRAIVEGHEDKYRAAARWEPPETSHVWIRFRRRPDRRLKARWREEWMQSSHRGICSWPPEDEIQEKFMDFVRKRAQQVLTEDRREVQQFTTSLLDGLDIRETTRNWHTGKLYVQSTPPPLGTVGAVVVVWEDEPISQPGSWRTTLYAENQNESDISFYATPLGEHVVGPRIARTEFGGLLSVYPAWGIPDIWSFALREPIVTCADALLAAGILFSPGRYIAYVARRPPKAAIREMAAAQRRHVIYLPFQQFSTSHMKKIRRFHILDGRDVRAWARDYIFED